MRRWLVRLALVLFSLVVAAGAYVRLAPSDPTVWHLDPVTVTAPGTPNAYRVAPPDAGGPTPDEPAPVYAVPAAELAEAIARLARDRPRTRLLAESGDGLHATYVARSLVFGFPDYVSVRAIELGDGRSTLAIFSRARFGQSDMGVNAARVQDWLAALAPLEAGG